MQKGEVVVASRDFYAGFTANYKCAEVKAIKMQLKCFVTLSGAFPTNKGNCSEILMQLKSLSSDSLSCVTWLVTCSTVQDNLLTISLKSDNEKRLSVR